MKILLIEPAYKNKYPPIGLMKLSTYHKQRGDNVTFYKGCSKKLKAVKWHRIYISTLFTFDWNTVIKTIGFYLKSVDVSKNMFVGGVMATLKAEEIRTLFDVMVIEGMLNENGKIGFKDDGCIEHLMLDYSILSEYEYSATNCYFVHATRGCIRKCPFCAVPIIEPCFQNNGSITKQIESVKEKFGEQKDLMVMDNNILASDKFEQFIDEILNAGFHKGATLKRKKRILDFNQGIDARLLNKENMRLIAKTCVSPLRVAFDDIKDKEIYTEKVRLAAENGIKNLSNYILFNFKDKPIDFYERLRINIELNIEFAEKGYDTTIWSFPMKYSPLFGEHSVDRKYVGENWNKKYLRGLQCILIPSRGVVGRKKSYFLRAFGNNIDEFINILNMPEDLIMYRDKREADGTKDRYVNSLLQLNDKEREIFNIILAENNFKDLKINTYSKNIKNILSFYL